MRRAGALAAGGVTAALGAGVASYLHANVTGLDRGTTAVAAAGYLEKRITVDGVTFAYAEGPDSGPPLVLFHGQGSRWQDHMRVLPTLADDHHVFAVDVPGHGATDRFAPDRYTNGQVATALARFVDDVVGGPVLLSGHSSGGLLALDIAAQRPDLVSGLHLEDPPLFSSQMPRLLHTAGAELMVRARDWLAAGKPGGFQRYFVQRSRYFAFFGRLEEPIRSYALHRIDAHPDEPLLIPFLPPFVNVFFPGLVRYDPAFGASWLRETGGWYSDFDTEAALRAVSVPTGMIHTNYVETKRGSAYGDDGVLQAAMDSDDAARAVGLLPGGTELVQLQCGHLVHFERPDEFVDSVRRVSARVRPSR